MKLIHKKDMALEALQPANANTPRTSWYPATPFEYYALAKGQVRGFIQAYEEMGTPYPISGDNITLKGQDR